MSNVINEIDNIDLVFVFGYNLVDFYFIVVNYVINVKCNGVKIIVCDLCKIEIVCIVDMYIVLKNGLNIVLFNVMGYVIIEENLYDKVFVVSCIEGFEEYSKIVEGYMLEFVEEIIGVSVQEICQVVWMYVSVKSVVILWGMGVIQFYQGVEIVCLLISFVMLIGNFGKLSVGVNLVCGQNNVQGVCDMGVFLDIYLGYQYVKFLENCEKFVKVWGVESLFVYIGYCISELLYCVVYGEVCVVYIMGEDLL